MADTFDILRKLALQVRNATLAGENSAERVGRIFAVSYTHLTLPTN